VFRNQVFHSGQTGVVGFHYIVSRAAVDVDIEIPWSEDSIAKIDYARPCGHRLGSLGGDLHDVLVFQQK